MGRLFKVFLWVLALTVFLLSGCAGKNNAEEDVESNSAPETANEASSETEPAAEQINFEGTDMEGNAVSSDILSQSKLTMVNVWATYCNPCLSEMPGLGELSKEYDVEEFQIIGIISDVLEGEDQELAESLIAQTGADYTHLLLNESIYNSLLSDVTAVPTTFFIDENGAVLNTVIGAMEKPAWEEIINALLEEQ